jgi:acetyltransferase-like isoleucine patch superfamily enzyme
MPERRVAAVPIDRSHAFAGGPVYSRPGGGPWRWLGRGHRPEARAHAAWTQFDRMARLPDSCRLGPSAWCANEKLERDRVTFGEGVICRGVLRVESFGDGRISLGRDVYVGDDVLLSSSAGIEIGNGVLLAHGVQIFDNDSHPLDAESRERDFAAVTRGRTERSAIASAPVRIGANAWIGFNAVILKGVTIGAGSVVAAGSVVTKDVPAGAVVAGNPAILVKELAHVSL